MLQRIHRDFTRWREDMNFMLEWREQYASNDLFVVVNKAKNRLNRTLCVFYSLSGVITNRSHATVLICSLGFLSSLMFHQWFEYESKRKC